MQLVDKFEELAKEIREITLAVDSATKQENWDQVTVLKRELYTKKIEQIDELESENALASTLTAKQLRGDVEARPHIPRYETGIGALDEKLKGGIESGTFIQLAGESFAGKTHLTLEILSNISNANKVLFFNFEMGDTRISNRLYKLLTTEKQWNNFLINSKARKINDIIKEIKSRARDGIRFFAIDSKMKIEVPSENDAYKAINEISKQLSKVAQQEEIIIFLINQMNEEDQKNNRLAFKGSGDQMYDTDIALFYMVKKEKNVNPEQWKRTLVCRKNRQDEVLFSVDLHLDHTGKTVGDGVSYSYENIKQPEVTEYNKNNISMSVL